MLHNIPTQTAAEEQTALEKVHEESKLFFESYSNSIPKINTIGGTCTYVNVFNGWTLKSQASIRNVPCGRCALKCTKFQMDGSYGLPVPETAHPSAVSALV